MLRKVSSTAALIVLLTLGVSAQAPRPNQSLVEMKKLHFLVGTWKGEGWNEMVPGQRRTSPITETVQPRLGGVVLLVEGLGKAKQPGQEQEVVTHHALGLIGWDENAKVYKIRTFLAEGRSTDAEAKFVADGVFQWAFTAPQGVKIRYTVKLTDKGEWFEIGEISMPGSTDWRKFHEMTLQKVN